MTIKDIIKHWSEMDGFERAGYILILLCSLAFPIIIIIALSFAR